MCFCVCVRARARKRLPPLARLGSAQLTRRLGSFEAPPTTLLRISPSANFQRCNAADTQNCLIFKLAMLVSRQNALSCRPSAGRAVASAPSASCQRERDRGDRQILMRVFKSVSRLCALDNVCVRRPKTIRRRRRRHIFASVAPAHSAPRVQLRRGHSRRPAEPRLGLGAPNRSS